MTDERREAFLSAALEARYRELSEPADCGGLWAIAELRAGSVDEEALARAVEHLQSCRECAEGLLLDPGPVDGEQSGADKEDDPKVVELAVWKRRTHLTGYAAGLLAVAVLLLVFKSPSHLPPTDGPQVLTAKGADVLVIDVVREGQRQHLAHSEMPLLGDELVFHHTSPAPGYLVLAHVDAARRVTRIHPLESPLSAPVDSGTARPIMVGNQQVNGVVTAGTGCEWVVAVFSDEPMDVTMVIRSLEHSEVGAACELTATVRAARAIDVVPMRTP